MSMEEFKQYKKKKIIKDLKKIISKYKTLKITNVKSDVNYEEKIQPSENQLDLKIKIWMDLLLDKEGKFNGSREGTLFIEIDKTLYDTGEEVSIQCESFINSNFKILLKELKSKPEKMKRIKQRLKKEKQVF